LTSDKVILVDEHDIELGAIEKIEAHKKALLHRAVSVLIFNSKKEMLIQRRALDKYHSPGLWTNTACIHPYPGESNLEAANRSLKEEMGMKADLSKIFDFAYKEPFGNGLTEYEFDHIFICCYDDKPILNPVEVADYNYVNHAELVSAITNCPENYTIWFK